MRKALASISAIVLVFSAAHAQTTDILIEIDTGRTQGMFTKSPVFQRAILARPEKPQSFSATPPG